MAINPQFSNYNPVPFTIQLPRRTQQQPVREIASTASGDAFRRQSNENFKRLQANVNEIRRWQDLAYDYRDGPLGVLNLHSDVDHFINPRQFDVLTWVNNQWTNQSLVDLDGVEMSPLILNQLQDVEHVRDPLSGHALIYDPQTALQEQNALRDSGEANYEDGLEIPSATELQAVDPNAPNFVQPWVSRFLDLSDLLDVSTTVSSVGSSNYHLFYFDPTDTSKATLGKTTPGLWKPLQTPKGNADAYLSVNIDGSLIWKTLSDTGNNLLELEDVLPNPSDAVFGETTCANPNILEFGKMYGFRIENQVSGTKYRLEQIKDTTTWDFSTDKTQIVCSGEQYIVKRKIVLGVSSKIKLEPNSRLSII